MYSPTAWKWGAGPGLIFQTLPLAFGQMSFGTVFGTLFFGLLLVAALTSAISMLEPAVEWLEEKKGLNRLKGTLIAGISVWLLGLTTVLSFNVWADLHPLNFLPVFEGKTFFDIFDYLTANIMLPLGGMFIVLYAGWCMKSDSLAARAGTTAGCTV